MSRRNALVALASSVPLMLASRSSAKQRTSRCDNYTEQTLQIGRSAKTLSRLALTQSGSFPVRKFAGSEILEQTAAAQTLTNSFDPAPGPLPPTSSSCGVVAVLVGK